MPPETPPTTPTWAALAAIEPRLWPLLAAARACPDDWREFSAAVKLPMLRLVGSHAPEGTPTCLRTCDAYEVVYRTLVRAWEDACEAYCESASEAYDDAA